MLDLSFIVREVINREVIIREKDVVDIGGGATATFEYSDRFNLEEELGKLIRLTTENNPRRIQISEMHRLFSRLQRAHIFNDGIKDLNDFRSVLAKIQKEKGMKIIQYLSVK